MLLMAANNNFLFLPTRVRLTEQLLSTADSRPLAFLAEVPHDARIALSLDCWTSPNRHSFVAVSGHCISRDWILLSGLLGFEPLDQSHTGVALAQTVLRVIQRYNLTNRIISITTDNAANNIVMAATVREQLARLGVTSGYEDPDLERTLSIHQHLPCLAHVLQLVLGALLRFAKVEAANDEVEHNWTPGEDVIQATPGIPVTLAKVCCIHSILGLLVWTGI